ncbi:MAG: gliding motility-associated C-terminal domain-containing protein [Taibaiella sp.]|jgi:gliding motility-associated-like protein
MPLRYLLSFFLFLCLAFSVEVHAQLVVNEYSQGASGNKEYIEFVVNGQRTCNDTCADIRGWMFDDNNGWYGTTAISPGCYRFKNDANWSCVPFGAIIVVYNSGDPNASLPADDPTDANNDGVYILPITSTYLEMNTTVPSSGSMTYPSSGFSASTTWTNLALNNTNDAVQTIDPTNLTTAYHAVSYGGSVTAPVHINASGSQKVYYLTGSQYNLSSAWTSGTVPANETPGVANNVANATWINGMLNGVGGGASFNDTIAVAICQPDSYLFYGNYYNTTGLYTETFVTGSGCDSLITLNLTASPIPPAPLVASPVTYCQDETTIALSATGTNLFWYDAVSGGVGSATAPVPLTGIPGSQVYYVSQQVAGCESPRNGITVITKPRPVPPVVPATSLVICQGAPVVTLSAQGQNILWYNQAVGGTGVTNAPVINTTNGHTVSWYATQTIDGCESERTQINVRVSAIGADFSLNVDSLCISDSLITNNLSIGNDYINHWDFGDGFSYVHVNHTHLYDHPGVFTVTLALTNSDGCMDTARKSIWVSPLPDVEVTPDKYHLCTGDEVLFNLKYIEGFSLLTWDFGDGNGSQQDNMSNSARRGDVSTLQVQHAYDTEGIYFFTTTVYTPGCGLKERRDSVNVHPMPKVNLGSDTAICLHGSPIILKNEFEPVAEGKYIWSTGETTEEIKAKHHGDYSLTVNTPYCSNTDMVHIDKDCYIDIPNAFTPNGNGGNDYFFPRQLLSSSVSTFQMQILNRWGQLIFETRQKDGRGWDGRFNGSDQPAGVYIYLIKVSFANGASESYQGNVTLLR